MEEAHATRGLRVIGVTKDEDHAAVDRVATEHGMTAPTYLDVGGQWSKEADVRLAPAFLLLDGEGRVAYRHAGRLTVDSAAYREMSAIAEKL